MSYKFLLKIRWLFYSFLGRVSDFNRKNSGEILKPHIIGSIFSDINENPTIWFFCSTIGELNACKPLIDKFKDSNLVFITDKNCYGDSFQRAYPGSVVVELQHYWDEVTQLLELLPVKKFILCEIPCTPHDAPCRLGYRFLSQLKKKAVELYIVNGWLYCGLPSCRQDTLEHRWFGQEYIKLFDMMMVQTEEIRESLISMGAESNKVHVTGNMKFDALDNLKGVSKVNEADDLVYEYFRAATCPVFVAGCVSFSSECGLIARAYKKLSSEIEFKMVIAPRHPENSEKMKLVQAELSILDQSIEYKSKLRGKVDQGIDVLVLDTYGELPKYYQLAAVSYVGANHNVLEPMAFGSEVITSTTGWDDKYPSFHVYDSVKKIGVVKGIDSEDELVDALRDGFAIDNDIDRGLINSKLNNLMGAAFNNFKFIMGTGF